MILTVNIGNTHITVGGYEQDTLIFCGRLHSDPAATVEEYAIRLVNLLQLYGASPAQIEGGILGRDVYKRQLLPRCPPRAAGGNQQAGGLRGHRRMAGQTAGKTVNTNKGLLHVLCSSPFA